MAAVVSPMKLLETWHTLVSGARGAEPRDERLRSMLGQDRHRPGPARWRLVHEDVPVWAIVGHLRAVAGITELLDPAHAERVIEAIERVAKDYDVSVQAVLAAALYYRDHRGAIDALLDANAAALA